VSELPRWINLHVSVHSGNLAPQRQGSQAFGLPSFVDVLLASASGRPRESELAYRIVIHRAGKSNVSRTAILKTLVPALFVYLGVD
jgi:hypothetical protein